jgi:hypothetical protein
MDISNRILSDVVVFSKYAKFIPEQNRRETWDEIITRKQTDAHKKVSRSKGANRGCL